MRADHRHVYIRHLIWLMESWGEKGGDSFCISIRELLAVICCSWCLSVCRYSDQTARGSRNFEDGIFHLLSGNGVPEGRDALTPAATCQNGVEGVGLVRSGL